MDITTISKTNSISKTISISKTNSVSSISSIASKASVSSKSSITSKSSIASKASVSSKSSFSSKSSKSSILKTKAPKTVKQKIWKVLKIILSIILVLILLYTILNIACSIYEKSKLKSYDYGVKLDVSSHNMVVGISGEQNEPTIVLLPGFGSASPVLHYKPLAEALSDKYKVITMEPFGYGLSDYVDTERTVDNIVNELHTAIKKLGIEQYYLMSHSIGGVYTLYWSNQYPKEVLGSIGLDNTVPGSEEMVKNMPKTINYVSVFDYLGLDRMMSLFNSRKLLLPLNSSYDYTEEEIKMFRIITLQKGFNKVQRKEISALMDNLNTVKAMKFPADIPVITFLSSNNIKAFNNWKEVHVTVGNESISNEIIEIPGDHVNFVFDQRETISNKIKSWTK